MTFESPKPNCSICLADIEDNSGKTLPCDSRHVFHAICIDAWLRSRTSCPICRTSVPRALRPVPTLRPRRIFPRFMVPTALARAADRLGLPPIEPLPIRPPRLTPARRVELYNHHLYGDTFQLTARNASNWFPQEWMEYAMENFSSTHQLRQLYNLINMGDSCQLITEGFRPPTNLQLCQLCCKFITNIPSAMQDHLRDAHECPESLV